jgi:PhoH-like ATPase
MPRARSSHDETGFTTGVARTYVLDTNVLVADGDAPTKFEEHDVVIPLTVVEELDSLKTRMDETGVSARRALRALEAWRDRGDIAEGVELPGGGRLRVEVNHVASMVLPEGLAFDKADNRILATTANLAKELGGQRRVVLVSKDVSLRIKAEALGIDAEEYRHERVEIGYTGVAALELPGSLDELYAERHIVLTAPEPLMANQFLILRAGTQSALAQVQRTVAAGETAEVALLPELPETFGVRARSKEQQFGLHLLRDPRVPLVSLAGNAGTGKTYMALAAGLELTLEDRLYDRVLVFRPVVPVGRQDLGFLPGDVDEKISPWMKAIHDILGQLFRGSHDGDRRETYAADLVQGLLDDGTVELEPLTFIRGRTLVRTFAILDEAQNVEYGVLRSLASRLGEGSKLVLCHDTSQVDHPYVDPDSGVAALVERLKGEGLFGHVTLVKGERSQAAELAARRL